MRTSSKCPKCEGTKIFVCENKQPDHQYQNSIVRFSVTTVATAGHGILSKEGNEDRTPVGFYETWICAGCGYTEWYAKDPENLLERLSKIRDSGVSVLSAPPAAPYR